MEDTTNMCTLDSDSLPISLIPLSQIYSKTKKCHSEARDRPDLIQTAPVPGGSLVRQNKMYFSDVTLVDSVKRTKLSCLPPSSNKTKKCQSNAGDRPDLIQTAPVPSLGLARQHNKNKPNEKMKNRKTNYLSHVKISDSFKSNNSIPLSPYCSSVSLPVANKRAVASVKHPDDKWLKDVLTKTKKCLPAVRDTLVTGPHTPRVTVGVPDSGRARPQNKNKQNEKYKNHKSNYLSNVTLVDKLKHTKWYNQSQVTLAINVLRSRSWSRLSGHGPHTPRVTVGHNSKLTVLRLKSRSRLSGHGQHTQAGHCGSPVTVRVTALRSRPTHSASHCGSQLQAYSYPVKVTVTALRSRPTYYESLWFSCHGHGHGSPVTAHILRESLWVSLVAVTTPS